MGLWGKAVKVSITVAVLILTFLLVYTPHFHYPLPLHVDEWRHITEARSIYEGSERHVYSRFETGFQVFLSMFYFIGIDLILVYKYLPALFASLTSAVIFFSLCRKFNYATGILGMVFFAGIRSNVNLLGSWFLTPLTFALPFMILFVFYFTEGIEKACRRHLIASLAFLLVAFFAHPITITFLVPALIIYLIIRRQRNAAFWLVLTALACFIAFLLITWQGSLAKTAGLLIKQLYFPYGWGNYEKSYSIISYYRAMPFLLAAAGAYFSAGKKQFLLPLWAATTLLAVWLFPFLKFSLFAPYQRMLYYSLIALSMLSAIGLYYLFVSLKNSVPQLKKSAALAGILLIIIAIALILHIFRGYYTVDRDIMLYQPVSREDLAAISSLRSLPKSVVMAPLMKSVAIYPLTGHKPVATTYFYGGAPARKDVESFYSSNCSMKSSIIQKRNVSFVLSDSAIECGWKELYAGGRIIYIAS